MKEFLIFFGIFGFITIAEADSHEYYETTTDKTKIESMQKGMNAVKARLKIPDSAQFKNVHLHRGANNILMTCGDVNSMDKTDHYIGFQRFISAGRSDLTLLEEHNADFAEIWNKFCR